MKHFYRFCQHKLLRGQPKRLLLRVLVNMQNLQLRRVLHLNQQRGPQCHVKTCRVEQLFVVRHDHAVGKTQLTDLMIS